MEPRTATPRYTPARVKAVTDAIRAGATQADAAAAAGISRKTLSVWLKKHPEFRDACEEAEGILVAELASVVVNAATGRIAETNQALGRLGRKRTGAGDPELALKLLASRWPADWGRRRVELTGAEGGPIATAGDASYRDRLRGRLDELSERRKRREAAAGEASTGA